MRKEEKKVCCCCCCWWWGPQSQQLLTTTHSSRRSHHHHHHHHHHHFLTTSEILRRYVVFGLEQYHRSLHKKAVAQHEFYLYSSPSCFSVRTCGVILTGTVLPSPSWFSPIWTILSSPFCPLLNSHHQREILLNYYRGHSWGFNSSKWLALEQLRLRRIFLLWWIPLSSAPAPLGKTTGTAAAGSTLG